MGRDGFEPSKPKQQIYSLPVLTTYLPTQVSEYSATTLFLETHTQRSGFMYVTTFSRDGFKLNLQGFRTLQKYKRKSSLISSFIWLDFLNHLGFLLSYYVLKLRILKVDSKMSATKALW